MDARAESGSVAVVSSPRHRGFWRTGDLARLFRCSRLTAGRMIDAGHLRGFRLPGSKRRVVLHADLIAFLTADAGLRLLLAEADRP